MLDVADDTATAIVDKTNGVDGIIKVRVIK